MYWEPEVRRHDDHTVLEIDGATLAVGDSSVIKHLQQDVEDIVMCLLDLVERG
jgi:hypothetical protein